MQAIRVLFAAVVIAALMSSSIPAFASERLETEPGPRQAMELQATPYGIAELELTATPDAAAEWELQATAYGAPELNLVAAPLQKREEVLNRIELKREAREQKKLEIQTRVQANQVIACLRMQSAFTNVLGRHRNTFERHIGNYNKLENKFGEIIDKLALEGVEVEALTQKRAMLRELISQYNNDVEELKEQLNEMELFSCEGDKTPVKEMMRDVRDWMQVVRERVRNIRQYYVGTMRPALEETDTENEDE